MLLGAPRAIVQTLDHTRPTIAGAKPCERIARHGESWKRVHRTSKPTIIALDGTNMPNVATAAPRYGRPGVAA